MLKWQNMEMEQGNDKSIKLGNRDVGKRAKTKIQGPV